ncbi:MAG TPA: STAS domain-containing protein [Burkholderiaceae bacterium]|jgi:anti-anti-sigma factor|nr:STAS domain-containing protein [Burkholderiaceae bacterium]
MQLEEHSHGPATVIAVIGRLDNATAPALGDRLSQVLQTRRALLIDLSRLDYISSAGFRTLLVAGKQARQSDAQVVLSGLSVQVRQLFEVGGFLKLFRVCGTREEGLSALH